MQTRFDHMLLGVSRDAVTFLDALRQFATTPVGDYNEFECLITRQRAQDSLLAPMKSLASLRLSLPVSRALEEHRIEITAALGSRKTPSRLQSGMNIVGETFKPLWKHFSREESQVLRLQITGLVEEKPQLP